MPRGFKKDGSYAGKVFRKGNSGFWLGKKRPNLGINNNKYSFNDTVFDKIDSEEKAYWAGFIAADGCILRRGKGFSDQLSITLHKKDIDHLKKFLKFLSSNHPIKRERNQWGNNYARITICSNRLSKGLSRLNIVPRKTKTYKLPQLSGDLMRHFVRGYFDGDGCFSEYQGGKRFNIVGIKGVILDLQKYFITEVGLNKTILGKNKHALEARCLEYSGNKNVWKIARHFYSNATVYLERKFNIIKDLQNKYEVKMVS